MAFEYEIKQGDVLEQLRLLGDESVDCCITSPPYWGLRDYGTGKWDGGDKDCDHRTFHNDIVSAGEIQKNNFGSMRTFKDICGRCGAIRKDRQLGLEKTPEEYVAKMVEVFGEVRRVLKKSGTLWLNLGDSYAGSGVHSAHHANQGISKASSRGADVPTPVPDGLKPKDIVGIPWRVAFALQAAGWWLRQDIIWSKPNPMPESVTDRCTKAHEYVFLMAKAAKYYFDHEAIKEPTVTYKTDKRSTSELSSRIQRQRDITSPHKNMQPDSQVPNSFHVNRANGGDDVLYEKRNKRSVWTVATKPYKEAHFATFPPDLVEPMILAGCPIGGVVLDPFCGSGTVGLVCANTNRRFIGIELNPEYVEMAHRRIDPFWAMQNQNKGGLAK